jgi:hypothetical protein
MAEVLAVMGGAAALTQLLHYGLGSFGAASALSHDLRHSSDKIEAWTDQSALMISLLDNIEHSRHNYDQSTHQLLGRCRKDADRLHSLLCPVQVSTPQLKQSKTTERIFVMRKGEEVERIISSYYNTFHIISSYHTM